MNYNKYYDIHLRPGSGVYAINVNLMDGNSYIFKGDYTGVDEAPTFLFTNEDIARKYVERYIERNLSKFVEVESLFKVEY